LKLFIFRYSFRNLKSSQVIKCLSFFTPTFSTFNLYSFFFLSFEQFEIIFLGYHVNKAILVGRVGADPLWYEFSNQMSSSSSSASSTSSTPIEPNNSNNPPSQRRGFFHFSLATSKPVLKRNENNESVREVATTWHRIQAFSGGDGNNPAVKILESGKIRKG